MREPKLTFGPDLVKLVTEIDEFKGRWEALNPISPDRELVGDGHVRQHGKARAKWYSL
jgi:hypothetical protein